MHTNRLIEISQTYKFTMRTMKVTGCIEQLKSVIQEISRDIKLVFYIKQIASATREQPFLTISLFTPSALIRVPR